MLATATNTAASEDGTKEAKGKSVPMWIKSRSVGEKCEAKANIVVLSIKLILNLDYGWIYILHSSFSVCWLCVCRYFLAFGVFSHSALCADGIYFPPRNKSMDIHNREMLNVNVYAVHVKSKPTDRSLVPGELMPNVCMLFMSCEQQRCHSGQRLYLISFNGLRIIWCDFN